MNILIKLTCLIGLVVAPMLNDEGHNEHGDNLTIEAAAVVNANVEATEAETAAPAKDLAELTGVWNMDKSHTYVDFSIRHMLATSKGNINNVTGSIDFGTDYSTAKMNIVIDVAALNTSDTDRDEHVLGTDFFDVAKFTTISFVSETISKIGDHYEANGKLTMHGVTKEVVLPFTYVGIQESPFKEGLFVTSLVGELEILRTDFDMGYMVGVLGDEVSIEISAELDQQR